MKLKKSQKKLLRRKNKLNLPIHYTPVYLSLGILLLFFVFWHPKQAVLGIQTSTVHKVCLLPISFFGFHFCLRSSDASLPQQTLSPSTQTGAQNSAVLPTPSSPKSLDLTALPLGDTKTTTTTPQKGYLYLCHTQSGGGGSQVNGPWIHGTTWDYTTKLKVSGNVSWNNAYVTVTSDGTTRTIKGNGLPVNTNTGIFPIQSTDAVYTYDFNPNTISAQTLSYAVPANPSLATTPSCVGGMVGVALNGVPIFNAVDGENRDAVAHEAQDECDGHPEKTGQYHYHNVSRCLKDEGTGHSSLIGYALDGFGIYGNRGENGESLTDSDLDECHGHIHEITWNGKKVVMYHYHATYEFPYTVGCFRGTASISNPQTSIRNLPTGLPSMSGQAFPNQPMMSPPPGHRPPPPPR